MQNLFQFSLELISENRIFIVTNGMIFGRTRGTVLFSNDLHMSSIHAQFDINSNQVYLTDLNSSNGCFVNNKRLPPETPTLLNSDDKITIGSQHFIFSAIPIEKEISNIFDQANIIKNEWIESPIEKTHIDTRFLKAKKKTKTKS